jgi:hypothetical protein
MICVSYDCLIDEGSIICYYGIVYSHLVMHPVHGIRLPQIVAFWLLELNFQLLNGCQYDIIIYLEEISMMFEV